MSEIDLYKHKYIGIINCPSSYEIVYSNNSHRDIPLYRLEEAVEIWQAKAGDVLLGGGAGESAALRISIPEAIFFFTNSEWDDFDHLDDFIKAYWTFNQAYIFCEGYHKLGWRPDSMIESWLAEHIIAFLLKTYPNEYGRFSGQEDLNRDGAICRLPSKSEQNKW